MATELGKAYVQIIPSAKGIKGQIENIIGGDVDNAGKSAGKSLGSGLVGTFSSVIAAAGIGTAIKSALDEGAALQQSLGGIDTIYGDAAEAAKKYASEASQAGISMNSYAEQAVSFGASLREAFGGDMTKAAEAANTAIMDMADNSAKMGTDIELIQNAYQGFAKGNYTMLDNLKLGYGGTKTEMERLLAKAQELTGVKYDINNLGDVYDAIHVIQDDLGIVGVAADEAKTTFSGSMAAMQASFSNVLAGLTLGQDITPALQTLVDTVITFGKDNLFPMMMNLVKGLGGVIKETALQVLGTDTSIVTSVMDSITAKLPNILEKGVEIVTNITNGILQNIPKVLQSAGEIISKFVSFIMQNLPTILSSGVQIVLSLVKGIIDNLPSVISSAATVVLNLIATFAKNLPQFLQQGITMLGQLAAGLIQAIPTLISKIPTIISNVVSAFKNHSWGSIGSDIIRGIASGISNAVGVIVDAAKNAARSAFEAAKEFLGINSPSRLFRYGIGQHIPSGLALGIEDNASMVSKAMTDLTKEATGTINADVSMGISQSRYGNLAGMNGMNANGGFQQNVNIYAPKELSPSEVARQTRNATRNMVLSLQGA